MIRLHDFRAALHRRHTGRSDEGSALLLTVVFTVFAGGVMLVLLAVLLSQMQAIQLAKKNTRTGYAAQAGIQATLSVLRSNTERKIVGGAASDYGDPTKLPQRLEGKVDGGRLAYSVSVKYFVEDPTNKSDAWLAANILAFADGTKPSKQPRFARIVSEGSDSSSDDDAALNRTITALYTFTTTNVNIPGGQINTKSSTTCWRADAAKADAKVHLVTGDSCKDEQLTLWVYDTDYRLKLASTIGTSTVLCITGRAWSSTDDSVAVTLHPCASENKDAPGNQLWSWESQGKSKSWIGQNKDNNGRSGRWLGIDGDRVVEKSTVEDPFVPTSRVGAGAARYETQQIVNFREFGRCMDVTNNTISSNYMIVYPCKQDPTGTGNAINWNHKWKYSEPVAPSKSSAPQTITVKPDSNTRCLQAPAANDSDVKFELCSSATQAQKFIRSTDTGDALTSYTFRLAANPALCLAAVPTPDAGENRDWSRIRVKPCDGSTAQKWNAPPQTSGSSLGSYKEIG